MLNKKINLDEEEKELLEELETALEAGTLKSVDDLETRRQELQESSLNTLRRTRNINLRMSERDLAQIKRKAAEVGIPYQTLVQSVLHRYANDSSAKL